jgi:hypothetical protein
MPEIEIELTPEQEFCFAAVKMHIDKVPREKPEEMFLALARIDMIRCNILKKGLRW